MASVRITLNGFFGLYKNAGEDLFSELVLPAKIERKTFLDTLFLDYGERPVLYTNPEVFRAMVGTWSSKWAIELERIADTLTDDYEPLWNIDRYEKVTDKTEDEASESASSATSAPSENTTSAYNSSSYEPDNKNVMSSSTGDSKSNDFSRDYSHDGHYYGNGGVTSSQSLAREELALREQYNMYHEACKLFADDLLLYLE